MTDCTKCRHKDDKCFCPSNKECKAFEREKLKIKYTFEFSADDDWVPGESACWTDCPFSVLLKLGGYCKGAIGRAPCPFKNEKYSFKINNE